MFVGTPGRPIFCLQGERARRAAMAREADVVQVAQRRYWREPEARILIEAWRSSGERLAGFARRHDFGPGRLARWVRRLGVEEAEVRFHAVRLVQRRPESHDPIEIELTDGRRVRVPRGFEVEELRRVLGVLGEAATC